MVSLLDRSTLRLGLWRLIFSRSFSGVGFLSRRIFRVRGMFGWSIYGVQHQRLVTGIAEVVLGTGRNGALVAGLDGVCLTAEVGFAGARNEGQNLVGVLVDFVTDFSADRNGHDHNLSVFPGPQRFAEVGVFFGNILDREVFNVAFDGKIFLGHNYSLIFEVELRS